MATSGEGSSPSLSPDDWLCRHKEAKGRANQSLLGHNEGRDVNTYALCGRPIRWAHVGGCGWIRQGVRDSDSPTTVTIPSAGPRCRGTHPLRHLTFP